MTIQSEHDTVLAAKGRKHEQGEQRGLGKNNAGSTDSKIHPNIDANIFDLCN
jgi:hypothetical protein